MPSTSSTASLDATLAAAFHARQLTQRISCDSEAIALHDPAALPLTRYADELSEYLEAIEQTLAVLARPEVYRG